MLLLFSVSLIELIMILYFEKNILSPAFIFALAFVISEFNALTITLVLGLNISETTCLVIIIGILSVWLGVFFPKHLSTDMRKFPSISLNGSNYKIENFLNREFSLQNWKLLILIIFNVISAVIIARSVVTITYGAGYSGNFWGAFGRYRELYALGNNKNLRLGMLPTLLTSLTKAEGYVVTYIIAKLLTTHRKVSFFLWLTFITALLTTFCQGDRGGLILILAFGFDYIFFMQKNNQYKKLFTFKNFVKLILIVAVALFIFDMSAVVSGKRWKVSFYEYFSVYLGGPIINLNDLLQRDFSSPIFGYFTFGNIIQFFYRAVGKAFPVFRIGWFNIFNGMNTGNVYTIFAYLISDFGFIGCQLILFGVGVIMQILFNISNKSRVNFSMTTLVYCFFLACLALSFFSDKLFENISVFNVYTFIFNFIFIGFLSRKRKKG